MQSKDFYTRPEAAAYLTDKGLPTTKGSLQKQATVGGGPEYEIWGNKAVYRPSKLDAYAAQKLKPSRRSTAKFVQL